MELREAAKLLAAPFADLVGQVGPKFTEKQKWSAGCELFSHEEQRRGGSQKQHGERHFNFSCICQAGDPLAKGPVSDLIVVLQERHKAGKRQIATRLTAPAAFLVQRRLALKGVTLRQTARQMSCRIVGIVLVVAIGLCSEKNMRCVVNIVVPLRRAAARSTADVAAQVVSGVIVVLQDHVNKAILANLCPSRLRQLRQEVRVRIVVEGVYGVDS